MKVIAVAGNQNAGKTSLVEALLQDAPADLEIGTIKSIHHDVEFDREGTDTYRHRDAGATAVLGMTPSMTAEFRTEGKADGVTVTDRLTDFATREYDWTIVEGFKSEPLPTVLVGDLDEDAVTGEVLFRVTDGTAVEGSEIWEKLTKVPDWEPEP